MAVKDERQCMITGCSAYRVSYGRGLCMSCYKRAKAKVDTGETTWDKLVERGLCETQTSPFDSAYDKAMEDTQ